MFTKDDLQPRCGDTSGSTCKALQKASKHLGKQFRRQKAKR